MSTYNFFSNNKTGSIQKMKLHFSKLKESVIAARFGV